MIMMLPFLLALISIVFAVRGQRARCINLWLLTLLVFIAWCQSHMTGTLPISL